MSDTKAHSALGASSASRWLNCPASVRLSAGIDVPSSKYAIEGTAAHAVAEHCLRNGEVDANDYIGQPVGNLCETLPDIAVGSHHVTPEMAEAVNVYLDHVQGILAASPTAELYVEQKIDLCKLLPDLPANVRPFGTCDAVIYDPGKKSLHVADYKHGAGIPVAAEANPQIRYYALGALYRFNGFDLETVTVAIVQPRAELDGQAVRTETFDAYDLMEWGLLVLKPGAMRTQDPDAPAVPGSWCRFCKAAGRTCRTFEDKALEVATDAFGAIVPPDDLTSREIGKRLAQAAILKDWIARVQEIADEEARAGRMPEGFKWVQGRGSREWRQSDFHVAKTVKDSTGVDITDNVVLSVAQAEKRLGKKLFNQIAADLVEKKPGKLKLAPLSDPAPAVDYVASATEVFSRITEHE